MPLEPSRLLIVRIEWPIATNGRWPIIDLVRHLIGTLRSINAIPGTRYISVYYISASRRIYDDDNTLCSIV